MMIGAVELVKSLPLERMLTNTIGNSWEEYFAIVRLIPVLPTSSLSSWPSKMSGSNRQIHPRSAVCKLTRHG